MRTIEQKSLLVPVTLSDTYSSKRRLDEAVGAYFSNMILNKCRSGYFLTELKEIIKYGPHRHDLNTVSVCVGLEGVTFMEGEVVVSSSFERKNTNIVYHGTNFRAAYSPQIIADTDPNIGQYANALADKIPLRITHASFKEGKPFVSLSVVPFIIQPTQTLIIRVSPGPRVTDFVDLYEKRNYKTLTNKYFPGLEKSHAGIINVSEYDNPDNDVLFVGQDLVIYSGKSKASWPKYSPDVAMTILATFAAKLKSSCLALETPDLDKTYMAGLLKK